MNVARTRREWHRPSMRHAERSAHKLRVNLPSDTYGRGAGPGRRRDLASSTVLAKHGGPALPGRASAAQTVSSCAVSQSHDTTGLCVRQLAREVGAVTPADCLWRAKDVLDNGKYLGTLLRVELLYQAEQPFKGLIRVGDLATVRPCGAATRSESSPFSKGVEVEPIEVSQLKQNEGVGLLDQSSLDLREVGVGAAGYPLDFAQRQPAVLTCVAQNTSDGRGLIPDPVDSHRREVPGKLATATGLRFRRYNLRTCARGHHRLTVEAFDRICDAEKKGLARDFAFVHSTLQDC